MYPPGLTFKAFARMLPLACLCLLALLGAQCLLIPDDEFAGQPAGNQRPTVGITGGVLENAADIGENRVHFYWYGADRDGVIRWFEWAVDDTISENAWHRTTSFDDWIVTRAATYAEPDGYGDWHTFYVRAVDDKYYRSCPDIRLFNAHTIAPTSEIESPDGNEDARWASTLRFTWSGQDLDAASADQQPAYYEIKHIADPGIDVTRLKDVAELFEKAENLLQAPKGADFPADSVSEYLARAKRAWKRVPGTVTEQWLEEMKVGSRYGFAVRAIDEAGAVEQRVFGDRSRNRNWVTFLVVDTRINVAVFEPSMGRHSFDTGVFADPWEVTIAPGQRFRLQWQADASASGTEPGPCNYGFDIPDPGDEDEPFRATDGRGGWIGWAPRDQMQDVISFPADGPKVHYFYLKMRDVSNKKETETRCVVNITLAQFGFTRRFLVVDDQRSCPRRVDGVRTDDVPEDAWRDRMLACMGDFLPPGEVPTTFSVFPDEGSSPGVSIPDNFLDILGEHQTVIWDCANGQTSQQDNALSLAAVNMLLSRYVGAGGNLLLFAWGGPVTKITKAFPPDEGPPKTPSPDDLSNQQTWNRFGFLWQYLHLRGAVNKPRGTDDARDLQSLVRAVSADPAFPDICLDYSRWGGLPQDPDNKRGEYFYECLVPNPTEAGLSPWYEREEGLEPIYTARCRSDAGHDLNDRPIAWRTTVTEEDLRFGIRRGKIVCFAFHPYFFDETATQTAAAQSLLWLAGGGE